MSRCSFCVSIPRRALHLSQSALPPVNSSASIPKGESFFGSRSQNMDLHLNHCLLHPLQSLQRLRNENPVDPERSVGNSNVSPSSFCLREYLVERYRDACGSNDAKCFHVQVVKFGFEKDVFLGNTLINVYIRNGDLVSSQKLFDEMPGRNSVTWACVLSGFTQYGRNGEACMLFRDMISSGITPNYYSFGSVLRACQELGSCGLKLGMQIHGLAFKTSHAFDAVVSNVLMSMYWNCAGSDYYAHRVFSDIQMKNEASWNSIISIYSQKGDPISAFKLLSGMRKDLSGPGFTPNEYTCGSLIVATCSLADSGLSLLEQMLCMVQKSGFLSDLYVGSALVSSLARVGSIDHARRVFDHMSNRNAVTLNGLIVGMVKQNRGEEATMLFKEMRKMIEINADSYVVLLGAFPEHSVVWEGLKMGKEVHGYAIRSGLNETTVGIGNGLINMYAKCGSIADARKLFDIMIDKDSVSWNSMITGLDQNALFGDAILCFHQMRRIGFKPCHFTLISALSSCASLGWMSLGQQIHSEGLKLGLDLDVSVSNALLTLYADSGYLTEGRKVFYFMPKHDQGSWNSMIGALANSADSASEAMRYFLTMLQAGWVLNKITFINVLAAVSSLSLHELVHQIHALVLKYSFAADTATENALLSCYGKCGRINECKEIFSRMADRRDEVSWNAMIAGYVYNELLPEAMNLVWFMMQRGQRLDCFTFATVLSACASVATLERGMEVHACAVRACLESDVVIGSALIDMYSKCGRIDYASRLFTIMPIKNVFSWNSMISGYARHGHGEKALRLFEQMKLEGQLPDHVTFVGVLSACSHVGLVDKGYRHFESMTKQYGLAPKIEHYSCMVDLLGRAGKLDKIVDFIDRMPIKPNILIWRTVLGACSRLGGRKTGLGRKAAEMLFELEPENAVNYVLLANMYASGGLWDDAASARAAMREAAVKKEAGCSWVTMKYGVHIFVAGDKSHPEKDMIYEKLMELNSKMRDAGYLPETKYALYDLEQESKEEILSYHSEKLAVAFVLTRKSSLPIRIMKNLRVCGDCHTAFKFISKIVGRQIILRDSNRFHHFNNGKCSCGDYW